MTTGDQPMTFLTAKEAAAILAIHVRTLERLVQRGSVRQYRIAATGARRFRKEDIERALIPSQTPDQHSTDLHTFIQDSVERFS